MQAGSATVREKRYRRSFGWTLVCVRQGLDVDAHVQQHISLQLDHS